MGFNYYEKKDIEDIKNMGIDSASFPLPCYLIKNQRFSGLSNDAKILYGLMLDKLPLSIKNELWDDKNRLYIIYPVVDIMEDLNCSKEKAVKVLVELDTEKGVGLIERIHRGLGKPDMIYVKHF